MVVVVVVVVVVGEGGGVHVKLHAKFEFLAIL